MTADGTTQGDLEAYIARGGCGLAMSTTGADQRGGSGKSSPKGRRRVLRRGSHFTARPEAGRAVTEGPVMVEAPTEHPARGTAGSPGQEQGADPGLGRAERGQTAVKACAVGGREADAKREGSKGATDGQPLQPMWERRGRL